MDDVIKKSSNGIKINEGTVVNNTITFAIGQGGANIGHSISTRLGGELFLINTSSQDLNSYKIGSDHKHCIMNSGNGAGKDSITMKNNVMKNIEVRDPIITFCAESIVSTILDPQKNINCNSLTIFVTFTSSGGTGSGIGPLLTYILNSDKIKETVIDMVLRDKELIRNKDYPIGSPTHNAIKLLNDILNKNFNVFGIAALPKMEEGIISMQNTVNCLNEIDRIINNKVGTFFLINPDCDNGDKTFKETDNAAALYLDRYLNWGRNFYSY